MLGPDVAFDIDVIDETNTRVDIPAIRALPRATTISASSAWSASSRTSIRAPSTSRGRFRAAGIPVVLGGFHVSGCLSMLSDEAVDLERATDLGVSLFAGEAEERLDR